MSFFQILKLAPNDVTVVCFKLLTPVSSGFEAMMEERQDQIPDERFLMTKKEEKME